MNCVLSSRAWLWGVHGNLWTCRQAWQDAGRHGTWSCDKCPQGEQSCLSKPEPLIHVVCAYAMHCNHSSNRAVSPMTFNTQLSDNFTKSLTSSWLIREKMTSIHKISSRSNSKSCMCDNKSLYHIYLRTRLVGLLGPLREPEGEALTPTASGLTWR